MFAQQWRCLKVLRNTNCASRCYSGEGFAKPKLTNAEVRTKRNKIFEEELKRQSALVTRFEKIQVKVVRPDEKDTVLLMNKNISTPHNCAMHLSEHIIQLSALSMVNGRPWDMHRPLVEDCELQFMHFKGPDPRYANKAYWRSCCFLLGLIAEKAFKDDVYVELHSWPSPEVRSGSFVYDVDLKVDKWQVRKDELRSMSVLARKICTMKHAFQVLDVDASVALNIFEDNRYKTAQIPSIAAATEDGHTLTLYRVDDHIDISKGPMIANTGLVGYFDVAAVFPVTTELGMLHRFQGVSLPRENYINHFAYSILMERASKMNPAKIPYKDKPQIEEVETPLHQSKAQPVSVA